MSMTGLLLLAAGTWLLWRRRAAVAAAGGPDLGALGNLLAQIPKPHVLVEDRTAADSLPAIIDRLQAAGYSHANLRYDSPGENWTARLGEPLPPRCLGGQPCYHWRN